MKLTHKLFYRFTAILLVLVVLALPSCKKYVEVGIAPDKLTDEQTYSSDASATSYVLSLYSYFPSVYNIGYFTLLGGVLSDELQYTGSDADLQSFNQSAVASASITLGNYLWNYPYQVIRQTNLAISGITGSTAITSATKNQLLGEAKFFRAYTYFYLVNYEGAVPLSLNPSGLENANLPRSSTDAVYSQIISDLKEAQASLPEAYAGTASTKARVNKWAATALLAKVYLYRNDYVNADLQSTMVIGSGVYTLPALSNTFINTSSETILQFQTFYGYSTFGSSFRSSTSAANIAPPAYVLHPTFTKSFETGDNRKTSWVDSTTYNAVKYYRINKYKLSVATAGNEYNIVLRLGEQYLIRAEARAQQNNISGSATDLNMVRNRAGLGNTTAITQAALLTAIANERKVELFGEYANRWFDLKRTGRVDAVLAPLKSTWKSTGALMPIPYTQLLLNTNLTQNPGY